MRSTLLRILFSALFASVASVALAAPKIGVLLKGRNTFWDAVEKGAKDAGAKNGAEITVKAPLSETDVSVQIQLLNAMAAQGMEAIVIAPINKEALAVPVASIAVKGVKIVVIDTALTGKAAPVFIGTDHQAAGEAAGKLLASLVSDADEVSFLKHAQSSGATTQREAGALTTFRAAHPNAVVHGDIYASVEPGTEPAKALLLLKQHPATKAVLASGTPGTLAMLQVLQEQKLAGSIKLVGFGFNLNPDVAAALENGAMSGWIAQLPMDVGAKGVNAALSLVKGEEVPPVVHTDFLVITKDNLKDAKVQALLAL
ncbi:MAG TPA: substrate-binding domain-containing protein [Opitutaceae bacterium]|nr:substrate-binding domain-containing protein [Opitutaceae bacterium]